MKMRIAAIHSGKHRESFSFVGIESDTIQKKIHVKLVRRWMGRDFVLPLIEIPELKKRHDILFIVADQNNLGEHNIKKLHSKNVPIRVITTQKNLKDPAEINASITMDKTEMVSWFLNAKKENTIILPVSKNPLILELESQIATFSEKKTEAGTVDYYAPGETHDDMVISLMLACFACRNYMIGDVSEVYKDYDVQEITDYSMPSGSFAIPYEDDESLGGSFAMPYD